MVTMTTFTYLPEIQVELSDNYSVSIIGRKDYNASGYTSTEYFYDNTDEFAKYIPGYRSDSKVTPVRVMNNSQNTYRRSHLYIDVFPDKDICDAIKKETNLATIVPTVIPPAYTTEKEIVKYIIDNELVYDFTDGQIQDGYLISRYLHCINRDGTIEQYQDNSAYAERYKTYNGKNTNDYHEAQENILHLTVLNEFLHYAIENNDYSINFGEFVSEENNVKGIVDKFSRFEITRNKYTDNLVDFIVYNLGKVRNPLRLKSLKTIKARKQLKVLTAQGVINAIVAATRDYDVSDKYKQKHYRKFDIHVKSSTYDIEKTLRDSFMLFNDKIDENTSMFKAMNIKNMVTVILGKRINDYILLSKDTDSDFKLETSQMLSNCQSLYEMIQKNSWLHEDSLAVMFEAFGYEYLFNRMKPTHLVALCRLFIEPGETLEKTSYLNNIATMITKNIQREDKETADRAKDYISEAVYYAVMGLTHVVAHKKLMEMDLYDLTAGFSKMEAPTNMSLPLLFISYNNTDSKYLWDKEIENLHANGM